MAVRPPPRVARLASVSLTVGLAAPLIDFYTRAFGFEVVSASRLDARLCQELMGVSGGADATTLTLGRETIEFVAFDDVGAPYPERASSTDLIFQHLAIVVADIDQAYRRLLAVDGWTPISAGGPQRLPASSGGVGAFKFRDPEGHPREFLAFPPDRMPVRWAGASVTGRCLGIDHSAIGVASVEASTAFYGRLGLRPTGGSLNHGPEQDSLDGLPDTRVQVMALAADGPGAGPHLELLAYERRVARGPKRAANNDVAATRLVFEARPGEGAPPAQARGVPLVDPDGHRLIIRPAGQT